MSPTDAARLLSNDLRGEPWFTSVGVGEENDAPVLYLYVSRTNIPPLPFLQSGWNGYRVILKRLSPRLAEQHFATR